MNLRHFITQLITNYQPVAENQKSSFVNSVPADITLVTEPETLALIMVSLLYVIARCSNESLITIDAGAHEDMAILTITDNRNTNSYAVLYEFQHLKLLSTRIGGILNINRNAKETTIAFGFINNTRTDTAIIKELKVA
ncbi:MAG: hypothetical protein WDO19_27395 [Bacteroidota bacterium]